MTGAALAMAALCAHAQHGHRLGASGGLPPGGGYRSGDPGALAAGEPRAMRLDSGATRGFRLRVGGPDRPVRPFNRYDVAGEAAYPTRRGATWYSGGITPVSAEAHPEPRPLPADTPVRAGSIREDVARYNEERSTFRPLARGDAGGSRPPMSSPYRN